MIAHSIFPEREKFFTVIIGKKGSSEMISRRSLLFAAGGMLVAQLPRLSAAATAEPFLWKHPGRDKLRKDHNWALAEMHSMGVLSKEAHDDILGQIRRGEGSVDEIPDDFMFPLMFFGDGEAKWNVVAITREWPSDVSRQVRVYRYRGVEMEEVVFCPKVCGNWSVSSPMAILNCLKPSTGICPTCSKGQG